MPTPQAHDLQIRDSALNDVGGNQFNVHGVVQVIINRHSGQHRCESSSPYRIRRQLKQARLSALVSPTGHSPRQQSRQSDSDTYARILLPKGHGYPLWIPEPPSNINDYAKEGLTIGDVGVVTFDGGFNYFFNVFLPRNHPHNLLAPPTLDHLTLSAQDVLTKVNLHPQPCVIKGGSVVTYTPEDR
jgi:hypothetical protein